MKIGNTKRRMPGAKTNTEKERNVKNIYWPSSTSRLMLLIYGPTRPTRSRPKLSGPTPPSPPTPLRHPSYLADLKFHEDVVVKPFIANEKTGRKHSFYSEVSGRISVGDSIWCLKTSTVVLQDISRPNFTLQNSKNYATCKCWIC